MIDFARTMPSRELEIDKELKWCSRCQKLCTGAHPAQPRED